MAGVLRNMNEESGYKLFFRNRRREAKVNWV